MRQITLDKHNANLIRGGANLIAPVVKTVALGLLFQPLKHLFLKSYEEFLLEKNVDINAIKDEGHQHFFEVVFYSIPNFALAILKVVIES